METREMNRTLILTVCGEAAEKEVDALFGNSSIFANEICSLTKRASPKRLGMTTQEVVINLTLGFVAGVPASMLATYIWEKISKNGQRQVMLDHKAMNSIDELTRALNRSMASESNKTAAGE
jgi:energy-converting hydrogenase Eha subunit A